mgnify:CR=1 FL=1
MNIPPENPLEHGRARELAARYAKADKQTRAAMENASGHELTWAFGHIWACLAIACGDCWQKLSDEAEAKNDEKLRKWLRKWDKPVGPQKTKWDAWREETQRPIY